MAQPALPLSSNQPDVRILNILGVLHRIALIIVAAVSGTILCAWLIPSLGGLLPVSWSLMKANTAVLTLLSGFSLTLTRPRRSDNSLLASRLLALFVTAFAAATYCESLFGKSIGLDTLLAADAQSPIPGRMSAQTAVSFILLGIVLFNLRARKTVIAYLVDGLTLCLALLMLVFTAGYVFGAMQLFGLSMHQRLSPQTLFCFVLLTALVFNRRTEYGFFSILIDQGIGGKTARLAAPFALLLPFTIATIRGLITRSNLIPEQYGVALAAALMSLIAFCLILFLSQRCKRLESAIRELSIRDQLTRLYNRRGFLLLAEQGYNLACRAGDTFFLLFIDMDNLKQINDTLGHEVGSELLQEMAALLEKTFRATDVIGRLGGDEFVVAGKGAVENITRAVTRLEDAANAASLIPLRSYPLRFSLGYVTSGGGETLEELLQRADSIMYEAKRSKKSAHEPTADIAAVLI